MLGSPLNQDIQIVPHWDRILKHSFILGHYLYHILFLKIYAVCIFFPKL